MSFLLILLGASLMLNFLFIAEAYYKHKDKKEEEQDESNTR